MNSFSELVTSSVLLRSLAILIVGLTVIAAIVVGTIEILERQAINPIVWTVVGTGLVQALAVLNINYGVVLQPATKPAEPPIAAAKETTPNGTANP